MASLAIVIGALVAWKPKKTIEIQIAMYRPFNWRLEPISMEKEITNTRGMGMVALVMGIAAMVYIVVSA